MVQNAVAAAGIPAPAPTVFVSESWIGTPFLVMPEVSGFIPGPAPVSTGVAGHHRAAAALRRRPPRHAGRAPRCGLEGTGIGPRLPGRRWTGRWTPGRGTWNGPATVAPLPVLTAALTWCRRHQPGPAGGPGDAPALIWGDPRLGNLVFDDAGSVHAVLDWDLAAIGPPEMDLGWYFGLEFMMDRLFGQRVHGFPEQAEAVETYQQRSGHTVRNLAWHEGVRIVARPGHQRPAPTDCRGRRARVRPEELGPIAGRRIR